MEGERLKVKGERWLTSLVVFFTLHLSLFTLSACGGDRCNTPFGEGGTLDVTMPDFAPLSNVGGSLMINRGHKGIMITRVSYSEFVAFEGACPNDNDVLMEPDATWSNMVLVCPSCSSRFNALDGSPFDGSVTPCPLYQYSTSFDGRLLSIWP